MNITAQHWEALIHCRRCGFLLRFEPVPSSRNHIRQHDGIWLHWDCNDNHWWASDLTIEELVKGGMLTRTDPSSVEITPLGSQNADSATTYYSQPDDPLLKKLTEYYEKKENVPQFLSSPGMAAPANSSLPPGVENK